MSEPVNFTQDFVAAITGFQQTRTRHYGYVTDINLGGDTMRVEKDIELVLKDIFPLFLSKPVPLTLSEARIVREQMVVTPDLRICHQRELTHG